jgi:uncharacterized protein (DUF486 family)
VYGFQVPATRLGPHTVTGKPLQIMPLCSTQVGCTVLVYLMCGETRKWNTVVLYELIGGAVFFFIWL